MAKKILFRNHIHIAEVVKKIYSSMDALKVLLKIVKNSEK